MNNENVIMKNCLRHGMTEHVLSTEGRYRCRKCRVLYDYKKRQNLKIKLVEYKGGECEICGYNKCYRALDFHHIDPSTKLFNINANNLSRNIKELYREADKCQLLCSNCHRELHYNEELIKETNYRNYNFAKKISTKIELPTDEVIKDIQNGIKQKDIAIKYNVSLSTIRRFVKDNNLLKKHCLLDEETIINEYKNFCTYTETAKVFNITENVLRKRCKKLGIIPKLNDIRERNGLKKIK